MLSSDVARSRTPGSRFSRVSGGTVAAAGFALMEQSASGMGNAFAGQSAAPADASYGLLQSRPACRFFRAAGWLGWRD